MTVNTKINYLYRDAHNYKQHNEVVVFGTFTEYQIDIIMDCLDGGEYFIPKQVGLPEERFDKWTEDDHCWFELERDGFEATDMEPNVDLTCEEMIRRFMDAKGNWKENENEHGEEYVRRFEQSSVRPAGEVG